MKLMNNANHLRCKSPPPLQGNLSDRSWPFLGSATVHLLYFAMLTSPVFNYPLIPGSQSSPTVLWFSLFSPPDNNEEAASSQKTEPVAFKTVRNEPEDQFDQSVQTIIDGLNPEASRNTETRVEASDAVFFSGVPGALEAATEAERTYPVKQPTVVTREQKTVSMEHTAAERHRAPVLTQPVTPALQPLPKTSEPPKPEKPAEIAMTSAIPLFRSDLKLVIFGATQPEITVTFVDFSPSRRDKPLSRTESRRDTKIIPLITNSRDTVQEIVILTAKSGVYTITAESATNSADVSISLKLYEGTARTSVRELGKHSLANKKVLVKILMPEGILWDDAAAFSGSMEDSEGITKFNTDSGLMWREYSQ